MPQSTTEQRELRGTLGDGYLLSLHHFQKATHSLLELLLIGVVNILAFNFAPGISFGC